MQIEDISIITNVLLDSTALCYHPISRYEIEDLVGQGHVTLRVPAGGEGAGTKTWAQQLYDTLSSPSRPAQLLPLSHALCGLLKGKDCVFSVLPQPRAQPKAHPRVGIWGSVCGVGDGMNDE